MQLNLNSLRAQIEEHLKSSGMIAFPSLPRVGDIGATIYWDTARCPEFKDFLAAAETAGVKIVTLFARELEDDLIDDTLAQLDALDMDRDERRSIEKRIKEMRAYVGFTCEIELAFDLGPRVYMFDLQTEWFSDLNDLIDQIEELYDAEDKDDDEDEDEDDMPLRGGYFPKN
jgi:hypothetical protein